MYSITKSFTFEYGHRVWSQELDHTFSEGSLCKCRHLHGHSGTIEVRLSSKELINDMVFDFGNLAGFKKIIDAFFDHKMILDKNDPALSALGKGSIWRSVAIDTISDIRVADDEDLFLSIAVPFVECSKDVLDVIDGYIFINGVPTSERLSALFLKILNKYVSNYNRAHDTSIRAVSVTFRETQKTSATYFLGD